MNNSLGFCMTLIDDIDKKVANLKDDDATRNLLICVRDVVFRIKRRIEQDINSLEAQKEERRTA